MSTGRFEHQIQVKQKTANRLATLPSYVTGFSKTFKEDQFYTVYAYVCTIGKFLNYLETSCMIKSNELHLVTMDEINSYIQYISYKEVNGCPVATSGSCQATTWTILNNFFQYLVARGLISSNPVEKTKRPRVKDKIKRVSMTPQELNIVVKAPLSGVGSHKAQAFQKEWRERDAAILLLLACTGMRINALDQINIQDINFETGILTVIEKGIVERTYELDKLTQTAITEWLIKRYELMDGTYSEALFVSNQRQRLSMTALSKIVKKYSSTISKHITPHKFRSTFINLGYQGTKDINKVQQAAGHVDVATTLRYFDTDNSATKEVSGIVSGFLSAPAV